MKILLKENEGLTVLNPQGGVLFNTPTIPNAVDMGLPSGRKWADRNVGADQISDSGLYFQWGDVEGFSGDIYRICDGERTDEYQWTGSYSITHGCLLGDAQNIPVDPYFDAARKNVGAPWRMPTKDEFDELIANTSQQYVSNYQNSGTDGVLFTSTANGNTLFLPAAGFIDGSVYVTNFGEACSYWSSSFQNESSAYKFYCKNDFITKSEGRYCGCSVRAVQ